VTTWTPAEQAIFASAESLTLSAGEHEEPCVEVGMVLVDGELYVRAYRGTGSRWYRAAHELGHGRIRVGDIDRDVDLLAVADGNLADAIDAAYHAKYGSIGSIATTVAARSATIRVAAA
jgi:hypothetical protein